MPEEDQFIGFPEDQDVLSQQFLFRGRKIFRAGDGQDPLAAGVGNDPGVFHRDRIIRIAGQNDVDGQHLLAGHELMPLARLEEFRHQMGAGQGARQDGMAVRTIALQMMTDRREHQVAGDFRGEHPLRRRQSAQIPQLRIKPHLLLGVDLSEKEFQQDQQDRHGSGQGHGCKSRERQILFAERGFPDRGGRLFRDEQIVFDQKQQVVDVGDRFVEFLQGILQTGRLLVQFLITRQDPYEGLEILPLAGDLAVDHLQFFRLGFDFGFHRFQFFGELVCRVERLDVGQRELVFGQHGFQIFLPEFFAGKQRHQFRIFFRIQFLRDIDFPVQLFQFGQLVLDLLFVSQQHGIDLLQSVQQPLAAGFQIGKHEMQFRACGLVFRKVQTKPVVIPGRRDHLQRGRQFFLLFVDFLDLLEHILFFLQQDLFPFLQIGSPPFGVFFQTHLGEGIDKRDRFIRDAGIKHGGKTAVALFFHFHRESVRRTDIVEFPVLRRLPEFYFQRRTVEKLEQIFFVIRADLARLFGIIMQGYAGDIAPGRPGHPHVDERQHSAEKQDECDRQKQYMIFQDQLDLFSEPIQDLQLQDLFLRQLIHVAPISKLE